MSLKSNFIQKFKNSFHQNHFVNIISSAFIRNLMGKGFFFKFAFKIIEKFEFNKISNFLHIRICFRLPQKSYPNYIDLDYYNKPESHYIVNLRNLPFKDNSIEEISVNYFFRYFPKKKHRTKAINNWHNKLIPGGNLNLLINKRANNIFQKLSNLNKLLEIVGFIQDFDSIKDISKESKGDFFELVFHKKVVRSEPKLKLHKTEALKVLVSNIKPAYYEHKVVALISKNMLIPPRIRKKVKEIDLYRSIADLKHVKKEYDFSIVIDFIEYHYRYELSIFFNKLRELSSPKSKIIIVTPYLWNFFSKSYLQLFNKGILAELIDKNNLCIEWMNLDASQNFIISSIKNENFIPDQKNEKIAILGNLEPRYSQLNSFWDGQIRALVKLGYNPLLLDSRKLPFHEILERIRKFNPKYLLTGDYAPFSFLKKHCDFFRNQNICVSYWYRDVRRPEKFDFANVINYVFLTNAGQIDDYKNKFNIENVFYLPQWCNPQFTHPNPNIKEKYDLGFAGQIDFGPYHKERTNILLNLKKDFDLKIENAEYNSISEFYSQCKLVFGNDMGFHKLFGKFYSLGETNFNKFVELYASNRIFISIGCGCCFFINYFPGIERMFVQGKHLVWYKNYNELKILIKKYLLNDEKRLKIKKNARKIAKEKHTHIHRIKNMLDIIKGKTDQFYGFFEDIKKK